MKGRFYNLEVFSVDLLQEINKNSIASVNNKCPLGCVIIKPDKYREILGYIPRF